MHSNNNVPASNLQSESQHVRVQDNNLSMPLGFLHQPTAQSSFNGFLAQYALEQQNLISGNFIVNGASQMLGLHLNPATTLAANQFFGSAPTLAIAPAPSVVSSLPGIVFGGIAGSSAPTLIANFLASAPTATIPPAAGVSSVGLPLSLASVTGTISTNTSATRANQHTPEVFQHQKLRSGKWLPEEEKYAELLIELFEKGRVEGCENGTTLRSYLSQKLHCAPMRISKKYAGKGIGKMVFVSKARLAFSAEAEAQHQNLLKSIKEAQEKFFVAVAPHRGSFSTSLDGFSRPLSTTLPGISPLLPSPALPYGLTSSAGNVAFPITIPVSVPAFAVSSPAVSLQDSKPTDLNKHSNSSTTTGDVHQTSAKPPDNECVAIESKQHDLAQQLRESFLKALHQGENGNTSTPAAVPPTAPRTDASLCSHERKAIGDSSNQTSEQISNAVHQSDSSTEFVTNMPDFLSGFNELTKKTDVNTTMTTNYPLLMNAVQHSYSPPFTSRSFDDLHRFLGQETIPTKDTAPPPATNVGVASSCLPGVGTKSSTPPDVSKKDSSSLFTAESYAMFAIESAMEASQHDAYLRRGWGFADISATSNFQKSNSIDQIHGMVKQLSEHVTRATKSKHEHVTHLEPSLRQSQQHQEQLNQFQPSIQQLSDSNFNQSMQQDTTLSMHSMEMVLPTPIRTPEMMQSINQMPVQHTSDPKLSWNCPGDYKYVSASEPSSYPATETETSSGRGSFRECTNSDSNGSDTNNHNESNASDASSTLHSFERGCTDKHHKSTSRKRKAKISHMPSRDKHVHEKQSRLANKIKKHKLDLEPESCDSFSSSDGDFSDISNSSELSNGASHEASDGSFSDDGNNRVGLTIANRVAVGKPNSGTAPINGTVVDMEHYRTNRFFQPELQSDCMVLPGNLHRNT